MTKKWRAYVINLDRAPERMDAMRNKLEKAGIDYVRVPAIDGKKVSFGPREIDEEGYRHCHGKRSTPTEIACYVSHYEAVQAFLASDDEVALIMEDDATASPTLRDAIEELLNYPDKWDMIKLAGPDSGSRRCPLKVAELEHGILAVNLFFHSSSAAYLVNRSTAQRMVERLLPMKLPYDHEITRFWHYDTRYYTYYPLLAQPEILASTIDYAQVKENRLPTWRRIPTFIYRMGLILQRIYYGRRLAERGRREWKEIKKTH